jgi:6-pyruvoyltetrahydropterin/6-carboxytetrahydropterin synthase
MILTKSIEFPMGHRLQRHGGLCRHVHGHNYKVEVEVQADSLDEQGMVIDFHDLRIAMEAVFKKYDHAFVIEEDDPFGDLLQNPDVNSRLIGLDRIIRIGMPPTTECLAKHWLGELDAKIGNDEQNCFVRAVTVYEGSASSVRYENHGALVSNRREVR